MVALGHFPLSLSLVDPRLVRFASTMVVASAVVGGMVIWRLVYLPENKNNQQSSIIPTLQPTSQPSPTFSVTPSPTASPTSTPTKVPTTTPSVTSTPVPTIRPTVTAIPVMPEIVWANRSIKQVVFTFDAGSGNTSITPILQTLAQYHVEGSFFLTGTWAATYPDDVKRIAAGGHAIYNHTYTHPHLTQVSDSQIMSELSRTDQLIKSEVGFDTKPFFRAPYGERNAHILAVAASQGYRSVYWTVDALDWQDGATASQVKARVLNNLQPGTIYLMHVGDPITGQVLPSLFQDITSQQYQINALSKAL